jgi:hemolysin activation/secretion protein
MFSVAEKHFKKSSKDTRILAVFANRSDRIFFYLVINSTDDREFYLYAYIALKLIAIFSLSITALAILALRTKAQSTSPPQPKIPSSIPERIRQTIPTPSESTPSLPPQLPTSPQPQLQIPNFSQPSRNLPNEANFWIEKIKVQGNTVLQAEIDQLIKGFEHKKVTLEDLITLRSQITQLYVKNGYITSGAFLPTNQNLSDGIIKIQVVEGELEGIEIGGLKHLRENYVRSRLRKISKTPLKRQEIEQALQLLQIDPLIEKVNAELIVGTTPARNILLVNLKEAPRLEAGITVNNYRSPSVGSEQIELQIAQKNLLGFGDRLGGSYGITEGLNIYNISYDLPVNANNGTINFSYDNGDSQIVEAEFKDLNIDSDIQTYSIGFRQPIVRSPNTELAIGLSLDLRRSNTFFNEQPYDFTPGSQNGESNVTVLRLSQDWVDRNTRRVLAFRSQFNIGLDAVDATNNDTEADGVFFSWLGQFQWVQQLSPKTLLLTRFYAQFTPDPLLSLEQFSLGGIDTVRGYRQNQIVADNGIFGSIEYRISLTSDPQTLQITPFFDFGTAWSDEELDLDPATLASLGVGLDWQIIPDLSLLVDYGIPLIESNNDGNTLQDNGFYFSIQYYPF